MKISSISVYQVDLPMKEGSYSWSTQSFSAFDSTVVVVQTDEGITGFGEVCPLGPTYLAAYAEGARTGISMLAPNLIGQDPCQLGAVNQTMDQSLKGHPYVKSAIDMACWDIFGKATGQPVYNLLGGRLHDKIKLFKVISRTDPDIMADKLTEYQDIGFTQFQMKVGEDPDVDIQRIRKVAAHLKSGNVLTADANTGWFQHDAIRVVSAVSDINLYIEQPCLTYEECRVVRDHSSHPMILDECMDSLHLLLRGYQDQAMDLINLKISRVGGLTRAHLFRNLCASLGIVMTIEDSWGGEIATAAIAHLSHSTPKGFHFQSSPFHDYATIAIAEGGPCIQDGYMWVNDTPGLGVTPDFAQLGKPVMTVK